MSANIGALAELTAIAKAANNQTQLEKRRQQQLQQQQQQHTQQQQSQNQRQKQKTKAKAKPRPRKPKQSKDGTGGTKRNVKKLIGNVRVIPSRIVKKVKHEWMEELPNGKWRKMLPDDVIDICPSCNDGPIRWSDIRNKRKAGPESRLLTCNRQAAGRCDYSGAKNRSTRRNKAEGSDATSARGSKGGSSASKSKNHAATTKRKAARAGSSSNAPATRRRKSAASAQRQRQAQTHKISKTAAAAASKMQSRGAWLGDNTRTNGAPLTNPLQSHPSQLHSHGLTNTTTNNSNQMGLQQLLNLRASGPAPGPGHPQQGNGVRLDPALLLAHNHNPTNPHRQRQHGNGGAGGLSASVARNASMSLSELSMFGVMSDGRTGETRGPPGPGQRRAARPRSDVQRTQAQVQQLHRLRQQHVAHIQVVKVCTNCQNPDLEAHFTFCWRCGTRLQQRQRQFPLIPIIA